jgi:hypothetical protein
LNQNQLIKIANQFKTQKHSQVTDIQEFGRGNINHTFLVTLDASQEKRFILQCLNTQVFHKPELVMQNLGIFSRHVCDRLQCNSLEKGRRWEVPRVLLNSEEQDYWIDEQGSFWRAMSFIEAAQSFDTIEDSDRAYEVGYALGTFHNLVSDLPVEKLVDTLEGFHITPSYLQHYQKVLAKSDAKKTPEIEYCQQFISDRAAWAHVLENAKEKGQLRLRPIHGDPKVNNVLIDKATGRAISIIDLDTVKPGLIHYDIGDCLRSGCNPLGEETQQWEDVRFDTDMCKSILQGYLSVAKDFLTESDYQYIYDSIRLIAFELGLRFFSDYLENNVYFKVNYPEQNLSRAIVQFKLVESIEMQKNKICNIVREMR